MTKVRNPTRRTRRRFIQAGMATMAAPWFVPTSALSADGSRLPSKGPPPGELRVGFSQLDITPPVGVKMTGAGIPLAVGTDDPLLARTVVAQSGDRLIEDDAVDALKSALIPIADTVETGIKTLSDA